MYRRHALTRYSEYLHKVAGLLNTGAPHYFRI